jgi:hypothetical protein
MAGEPARPIGLVAAGPLARTARLSLASMLALMIFLIPSQARADGTEAWQVSGTMQELNGKGTATGDLAGSYTVKFISVVDDGTTTTVISRRTINTEVGNVVFDEVGYVDDATGAVSATSTVSGGNGIFKDATGVLDLLGQINADGSVSFTYTGTIYLED